MSNQYRIERDRDVVCVVDCGRLMAAPFADRTRLDAALDAAVAVAAVADELGDRCGAIAFDGEVLRSLPPRRAGARDVVSALFDLEPVPVDSDYELAFAQVRGVKRAFVLVFTDLLEESAAQPLVDALPVLARRHAVVVAGSADPDLDAAVRTEPHVRRRRLPGGRRPRRARRSRARRRAAAARGRDGGRGARRRRSPPRASGRICERSGWLVSDLTRPRQSDEPPEDDAEADADADHGAEAGLRQVGAVPLDDAGDHEPRRRPEHERAAPRPPRAAARRGACAGRAR